MSTLTPEPGNPTLALINDLRDSLSTINHAIDALKGIGNLMSPSLIVADEYLNMATRSDASSIFCFFSEVLLEPIGTAMNAEDQLRTALFYQPQKGA